MSQKTRDINLPLGTWAVLVLSAIPFRVGAYSLKDMFALMGCFPLADLTLLANILWPT